MGHCGKNGAKITSATGKNLSLVLSIHHRTMSTLVPRFVPAVEEINHNDSVNALIHVVS
jgi:hypothetical protein